jgi:hypothetical protein
MTPMDPSGGAQHVHTLRLAEMIMAIVACRRRLPQATSAALIREPHGDATLIRVVFMDERQQPLPVDAGTMMATAYLAAELDDNLHQAFGARNVIVLK